MNLWTDFVKTGTQPCDPNCWTPFTKDNQKRLKISTKGLEMISIDQELQDFWLENVWPKLIGNFTYKKISDDHYQIHISNKDELWFLLILDLSSLGTIQVLRHHDFDLFWPTHPPYQQTPSFPIPTLNMTSSFPHTHPPI